MDETFGSGLIALVVASSNLSTTLPRNNPQRFYDFVVQVALIRNGPIVGQMTNPYLKRWQGIGQNQDEIVHLRAHRISPLNVSAAATESHDFH
jgi:hypothetical protein